MRLITLLLILSFGTCVSAQRVLIFEKLTASKSDRVYEGEYLKFKMKGDKFWQEGPIREMRPDIQALIINDRFVMLDEIDTVHRGATAGAAVGYGLMTFGVGWSFWSLAGNYTDGNPLTKYENRDLMITLTSVGTGFLINKLLGQRKYKTGKYKRLRVIDTSF
ncbi:hypothetical protein FUA23_13560 [Neolewinella aurantiaca]|uniref:Uncharacterized protein n=1 Tax=Neolewinella aurantiaca TaxID=2602767 RepID=A0A5C7FTD8_9BACT|nr:hypothetical protein [Neolewinella aurantiaca]TXF88688.1 hypothetical protein FUA23_13560 [Neolewinella aurantiaca]